MRCSRPLKLAYFSPLPPMRSGIADYSRDLLPYLDPWADVHLFIDDYQPSDPGITWRFPVWSHRDFAQRDRFHSYDCPVYHLGNNPVHAYLYPYVFRRPGVIVLHDLVVHHLLAWMAFQDGRASTYLREFSYSCGSAGMTVAWEVLTGRRSPPFFDTPLCERAVDASLGVIVHSRYIESRIRESSPDARVRVIPMPMPLGPEKADKVALRRQLGLPPTAFIVGSLGEATHHKRLEIVLRAFARLAARRPEAVYVIAGHVAPGLDLAAQAERLGVGRRVRITGTLSADLFAATLGAVDVSVNLRYPTAGETSAAALRSLAAGLPTIVSDLGANQELPGSCCFKLPLGGEEELLLAAVLEKLAGNGALRTGLGAAGRRYIAKEHAPARAARDYILFVEEVLNSPSALAKPRSGGHEAQASALIKEVAGRMREIGLGQENQALLEDVAEALKILEGGMKMPRASEPKGMEG